MPAPQIPLADRAIATAVLDQLYAAYIADEDATDYPSYVLDRVSRVRFQPSTRQLVLTFDLAMGDKTE